jgi:hypothetical protein
MPSYRVIYEIDIFDVGGPVEAARRADYYMQKENRHYEPQFYVTDTSTGISCSIDLDELGHPE